MIERGARRDPPPFIIADTTPHIPAKWNIMVLLKRTIQYFLLYHNLSSTDNVRVEQLFSFPTLQATPDSGHFSSPEKVVSQRLLTVDTNTVHKKLCQTNKFNKKVGLHYAFLVGGREQTLHQ